MGKFRTLLNKDWLKYGFETFAVLVGVLGAFALENWQDTLRDRKTEKEYIQNLISMLNHAPKEIDEIVKLASSLSRKTFVVYNPVFEDLKYSGHLSLLSITQHKNAVLGFYQLAEYVERVLNQNNAIYAEIIKIKN